MQRQTSSTERARRRAPALTSTLTEVADLVVGAGNGRVVVVVAHQTSAQVAGDHLAAAVGRDAVSGVALDVRHLAAKAQRRLLAVSQHLVVAVPSAGNVFVDPRCPEALGARGDECARVRVWGGGVGRGCWLTGGRDGRGAATHAPVPHLVVGARNGEVVGVVAHHTRVEVTGGDLSGTVVLNAVRGLTLDLHQLTSRAELLFLCFRQSLSISVAGVRRVRVEPQTPARLAGSGWGSSSGGGSKGGGTGRGHRCDGLTAVTLVADLVVGAWNGEVVHVAADEALAEVAGDHLAAAVVRDAVGGLALYLDQLPATWTEDGQLGVRHLLHVAVPNVRVVAVDPGRPARHAGGSLRCFTSVPWRVSSGCNASVARRECCGCFTSVPRREGSGCVTRVARWVRSGCLTSVTRWVGSGCLTCVPWREGSWFLRTFTPVLNLVVRARNGKVVGVVAHHTRVEVTRGDLSGTVVLNAVRGLTLNLYQLTSRTQLLFLLFRQSLYVTVSTVRCILVQPAAPSVNAGVGSCCGCYTSIARWVGGGSLTSVPWRVSSRCVTRHARWMCCGCLTSVSRWVWGGGFTSVPWRVGGGSLTCVARWVHIRGRSSIVRRVWSGCFTSVPWRVCSGCVSRMARWVRSGCLTSVARWVESGCLTCVPWREGGWFLRTFTPVLNLVVRARNGKVVGVVAHHTRVEVTSGDLSGTVVLNAVRGLTLNLYQLTSRTQLLFLLFRQSLYVTVSTVRCILVQPAAPSVNAGVGSCCGCYTSIARWVGGGSLTSVPWRVSSRCVTRHARWMCCGCLTSVSRWVWGGGFTSVPWRVGGGSLTCVARWIHIRGRSSIVRRVWSRCFTSVPWRVCSGCVSRMARWVRSGCLTSVTRWVGSGCLTCVPWREGSWFLRTFTPVPNLVVRARNGKVVGVVAHHTCVEVTSGDLSGTVVLNAVCGLTLNLYQLTSRTQLLFLLFRQSLYVTVSTVRCILVQPAAPSVNAGVGSCCRCYTSIARWVGGGSLTSVPWRVSSRCVTRHARWVCSGCLTSVSRWVWGGGFTSVPWRVSSRCVTRHARWMCSGCLTSVSRWVWGGGFTSVPWRVGGGSLTCVARWVHIRGRSSIVRRVWSGCFTSVPWRVCSGCVSRMARWVRSGCLTSVARWVGSGCLTCVPWREGSWFLRTFTPVPNLVVRARNGKVVGVVAHHTRVEVTSGDLSGTVVLNAVCGLTLNLYQLTSRTQLLFLLFRQSLYVTVSTVRCILVQPAAPSVNAGVGSCCGCYTSIARWVGGGRLTSVPWRVSSRCVTRHARWVCSGCLTSVSRWVWGGGFTSVPWRVGGGSLTCVARWVHIRGRSSIVRRVWSGCFTSVPWRVCSGCVSRMARWVCSGCHTSVARWVGSGCLTCVPWREGSWFLRTFTPVLNLVVRARNGKVVGVVAHHTRVEVTSGDLSGTVVLNAVCGLTLNLYQLTSRTQLLFLLFRQSLYVTVSTVRCILVQPAAPSINAGVGSCCGCYTSIARWVGGGSLTGVPWRVSSRCVTRHARWMCSGCLTSVSRWVWGGGFTSVPWRVSSRCVTRHARWMCSGCLTSVSRWVWGGGFTSVPWRVGGGSLTCVARWVHIRGRSSIVRRVWSGCFTSVPWRVCSGCVSRMARWVRSGCLTSVARWVGSGCLTCVPWREGSWFLRTFTPVLNLVVRARNGKVVGVVAHHTRVEVTSGDLSGTVVLNAVRGLTLNLYQLTSRTQLLFLLFRQSLYVTVSTVRCILVQPAAPSVNAGVGSCCGCYTSIARWVGGGSLTSVPWRVSGRCVTRHTRWMCCGCLTSVSRWVWGGGFTSVPWRVSSRCVTRHARWMCSGCLTSVSRWVWGGGFTSVPWRVGGGSLTCVARWVHIRGRSSIVRRVWSGCFTSVPWRVCSGCVSRMARWMRSGCLTSVARWVGSGCLTCVPWREGSWFLRTFTPVLNLVVRARNGKVVGVVAHHTRVEVTSGDLSGTVVLNAVRGLTLNLYQLTSRTQLLFLLFRQSLYVTVSTVRCILVQPAAPSVNAGVGSCCGCYTSIARWVGGGSLTSVPWRVSSRCATRHTRWMCCGCLTSVSRWVWGGGFTSVPWRVSSRCVTRHARWVCSGCLTSVSRWVWGGGFTSVPWRVGGGSLTCVARWVHIRGRSSIVRRVWSGCFTSVPWRVCSGCVSRMARWVRSGCRTSVARWVGSGCLTCVPWREGSWFLRTFTPVPNLVVRARNGKVVGVVAHHTRVEVTSGDLSGTVVLNAVRGLTLNLYQLTSRTQLLFLLFRQSLYVTVSTVRCILVQPAAPSVNAGVGSCCGCYTSIARWVGGGSLTSVPWRVGGRCLTSVARWVHIRGRSGIVRRVRSGGLTSVPWRIGSGCVTGVARWMRSGCFASVARWVRCGCFTSVPWPVGSWCVTRVSRWMRSGCFTSVARWVWSWCFTGVPRRICSWCITRMARRMSSGCLTGVPWRVGSGCLTSVARWVHIWGRTGIVRWVESGCFTSVPWRVGSGCITRMARWLRSWCFTSVPWRVSSWCLTCVARWVHIWGRSGIVRRVGRWCLTSVPWRVDSGCVTRVARWLSSGCLTSVPWRVDSGCLTSVARWVHVWGRSGIVRRVESGCRTGVARWIWSGCFSSVPWRVGSWCVTTVSRWVRSGCWTGVARWIWSGCFASVPRREKSWCLSCYDVFCKNIRVRCVENYCIILSYCVLMYCHSLKCLTSDVLQKIVKTVSGFSQYSGICRNALFRTDQTYFQFIIAETSPFQARAPEVDGEIRPSDN